MTEKLTVADYPVAEKRPELVKGRGGKPLEAITLDAVTALEVTLDDLRITPEALRRQAEIARDASRATLGSNFERAAERTLPVDGVECGVEPDARPLRARTPQGTRERGDGRELQRLAGTLGRFGLARPDRGLRFGRVVPAAVTTATDAPVAAPSGEERERRQQAEPHEPTVRMSSRHGVSSPASGRK